MKKKFKVIATATVAIGMVGLATQGLAQQSEERAASAEMATQRGIEDVQTGCQNVVGTESLSGRSAAANIISNFRVNCGTGVPQ